MEEGSGMVRVGVGWVAVGVAPDNAEVDITGEQAWSRKRKPLILNPGRPSSFDRWPWRRSIWS